MKAMMVGGGTGGHVYPAIAIAQALQDVDIDSRILFVGSDDGIETRLVPKERFSLATIRARKMLRKLTPASIVAPFYAVSAIFESARLIRDFGPDIIIATGGFVSLPVVIAGFFLRVPVLLHEGNVTPGLSARICKWFASRITIAFEASRRHYRFRKVFCVGGPVRKEIVSSVKGISMQKIGLRQDLKTLLVLGGSQGARTINRAVIDAIPEFGKMNIQIIHVCGERDQEWVRSLAPGDDPLYHLIPYMYNIWDGVAAADIVVSRAGATALSEILARGVPSILVPFPFSSGGHQDINAKLLTDAGAAVLVRDGELTGERMAAEVSRILNDRETYARMQSMCRALSHANAAIEIVNIVYGMLKIDVPRSKKGKVKRRVKNAV